MTIYQTRAFHVNGLTEVSLHTGRLVLFELGNSTAQKWNNEPLKAKVSETFKHEMNISFYHS